MSHLKQNARHNRITASNAWAAVYERQKLWRDMTFRSPPFEGNEATEWGQINEPIALSQFEKEMDVICESGNKLILHPELPFAASPDAFIESIPVELKCPFTQVVYPEIPERYYFQVQLQLEVCDQPYAWFYVWTPDATQVTKVERNKDFIEWYKPLALEFLKSLDDDVEPVRWKRKPIFIKE